jgi:hypothetical protein
MPIIKKLDSSIYAMEMYFLIPTGKENTCIALIYR